MAPFKTEETWINSTSPSLLLATLDGKPLPRQRRLFAVACCRRWLHEILDPESRHAIEVAERYVDGLANRDELEAAYRAAQEATERRSALTLAVNDGNPSPESSVWRLAHMAQTTCGPNYPDYVAGENLVRINQLGGEHIDQERRAQCTFIRDIFGNPFRPQPVIDSSWLPWNGAIIPKLAQAIYDDRAFERLPILADALEEAGCTNADILNHCRQPGEHVRGCWVVDLLLGKS